MGYKKSLFIFMVLSFISFFININYFNDILIFSLNTDSIYYTNENDVFNFRTLNAALFFFISIIPLAITLSISKPNLKRALFFYFIVYLSLFISLSVKKNHPTLWFYLYRKLPLLPYPYLFIVFFNFIHSY